MILQKRDSHELYQPSLSLSLARARERWRKIPQNKYSTYRCDSFVRFLKVSLDSIPIWLLLRSLKTKPRTLKMAKAAGKIYGRCTRVFYLQSGENPQVVQPLRLDRLDVVHVQIQLGGFRRNPAWNLCKLRPRTSHHRTRAITSRRAVIVA